MRIINAMFGCHKGGIEQACLDYHDALTHSGHDVITVLHPEAKIRSSFADKPFRTLYNWSHYDPIAIYRLHSFIKNENPHAILCHGVRAAQLCRFAAPSGIPVIGITHNYSTKRLMKCDALFCITDHLRQHVITHGFSEDKTYIIPNMIRCGNTPPENIHDFRDPPVIASMGRFVKKKGFEVLIEAFSLLAKRNIPFKAVIGGDGEEKNHYAMLRHKYLLDDILTFHPWITDKDRFFQNMDIFCLPSLHEPFGIVLLEAMEAQKPIISTNAEGPSEILKHEKNALIVEKNDPKALADTMARLLDDHTLASSLASEAIHDVRKHFDLHQVAKHIDHALHAIIAQAA